MPLRPGDVCRATQPVLLVVGDLDHWLASGRDLPDIAGCHFTGWDRLDRALLDAVAPDVVLSALMAPGCDAIELARRLVELGYRGRFRAIAPDLPNPDFVIGEIRAQVPEIDFDILRLPF